MELRRDDSVSLCNRIEKCLSNTICGACRPIVFGFDLELSNGIVQQEQNVVCIDLVGLVNSLLRRLSTNSRNAHRTSRTARTPRCGNKSQRS